MSNLCLAPTRFLIEICRDFWLLKIIIVHWHQRNQWRINKVITVFSAFKYIMRRFVIISFCMCFMNSHAFESEVITDCIAIYYLGFIGRNQIHSLEDSILLKSFLGLICVILGWSWYVSKYIVILMKWDRTPMQISFYLIASLNR